MMCDWRPGEVEHFIYPPAGSYWFGRPPFDCSRTSGLQTLRHPLYQPHAWRLAQLLYGRRLGRATQFPGVKL